MLSRAYAGQYDSICRDQDDLEELAEQKTIEIENDSFKGRMTDHLDVETVFGEQFNDISRLLTEYKFSTVKGSMIGMGLTRSQKEAVRPASEIALELMHFMCCVQETAIEKEVNDQELWSN